MFSNIINNDMKKKSLKIITIVSASFIATSCSLFQTKYFDWMVSTNNNTEINYCLLIGQNEHSDSIERTRYTRQALDTRDEKTEINGNANLGTPKQGKLVLNDPVKRPESYKEGIPSLEFTVNELEHMEQKSLAGVVWDSITANGTTSTWISKHNKKITMIISNNDGMAEGALFASNWIQNLPLFGYDANTSTLKLITKGKIMGTVDQNASCQTSAAYLMIRNILEDIDNNAHNIGTTRYTPLNRGFNGEKSATDYGVYMEGFNVDGTTLEKEGITDPYTDDRSPNNMDLSKTDGYHQILSRSIAIDDTNIGIFVGDDGEVKTPKVLAWSDEGYVHKTKEYKIPEKKYNVCHVYNNAAEVYLQGTMHDYYVQYDDELGLNVQKIDGDGVDEQKIFSQLEGACAGTKFDAFLVNMVTTTDGGTFVDNISKYAAKNEGKDVPKGGWDNWEDRLNTPLIFWNKQPQTIDGKVDAGTMNNKYFKYTYFVGVDASYGGQEQGNMIVRFLDRQYQKSVEGK